MPETLAPATSSIICRRHSPPLIAAMLMCAAPVMAQRPLHEPTSVQPQLRDDSAAVSEAEELARVTQSEAVTQVVQWILHSADNRDTPFMVIDKVGAKIFVFDADGQPLGAAPILIGRARGDDSAPGVGTRAMSKISIDQRTTPAGRFIAKFGPAKGHPSVLWIDYADAISLHPVVTTNKQEHRLERMKSPSADDHRISFGCINVPARFYSEVVKPLFQAKNSSSVVYILPDTKTLTEVFPGLLLQRN